MKPERCASRENLIGLISQIGCGNAAPEYFLTDSVARANEAGFSCAAVAWSEDQTLGITYRAELAQA